MDQVRLNGGWSPQRIRFSKEAVNRFYLIVNGCRSIISLPGEALRGSRFNDDWSILARLESMLDEEEFMQCPGASIDKALIDAAQTDYWYAKEKDYEWPEIIEDETNDDE
ncbi:MAG TPA: hypothetical protein VNX68_14455 [Nitrosopumilaceae archaeon]|jgi:hypothetical protein|nr:hypothetical protein [Nitrosopumilaceae archaeon]